MAYVLLYDEIEEHTSIIDEISTEVRQQIGPIAQPDRILVVSGLPKTRRGKLCAEF